jgi:hypothetical protein
MPVVDLRYVVAALAMAVLFGLLAGYRVGSAGHEITAERIDCGPHEMALRGTGGS